MTTSFPRRTLATALAAITALSTLGLAGAAHAQSWPTKPIKLIVPYAAGGATDITARTIGEKLSTRLGQPVLVDNPGGAGGVTGTDLALKSPADGHSLLVSLGTTMLINQYLYEKLPYNPQKDQALITQMSQTTVCNRHHLVEIQLCRWLLLTLDRLPTQELTMTQELIANMLGVRREAVTEAAGKLQSRGLISYRRGHISVLDRAGLEAEVCECYDVVKKEFARLLSDVRQR